MARRHHPVGSVSPPSRRTYARPKGWRYCCSHPRKIRPPDPDRAFPLYRGALFREAAPLAPSAGEARAWGPTRSQGRAAGRRWRPGCNQRPDRPPRRRRTPI